MKVGDFVEVKTGILESVFKEVDMSGWRGVVLANEHGSDEIHVHWDTDTLNKLPVEYIEKCMEDGYEFASYFIEKEALIVLPASEITDSDEEREETASILEDKYHYATMGELGKLYVEILGLEYGIEVDPTNLQKYYNYLNKHIKKPLLLTGHEVFPSEERFFFGQGGYDEFKKDNAVSSDTFSLQKIIFDQRYEELIAHVRRMSDRKLFHIPLSYLEATQKKSKNYRLLNEYTVWIANFI